MYRPRWTEYCWGRHHRGTGRNVTDSMQDRGSIARCSGTVDSMIVDGGERLISA